MNPLLLAAGGLYAAGVVLLVVGSVRSGRRFRKAAYRFPAPVGHHHADPIELAVVVTARNEAAHLSALLEALDAQDYPSGALTMVIVDDGSTDSTGDLLAAFSPLRHRFIHLRQMVEPAAGSPKKAALAAGIAATGAPLLLLTDADCRPPPGWASGMAAPLQGGCPVTGGHSPSRSMPGLLGISVRLWELGTALLASGFLGLGVVVHMSGRNWGFRREVYRGAGGYSGLEHVLSGDDTLLAQKMGRIISPGRWGFTFEPALQVTTAPPLSWAAFFRQRHRHVATARRFRAPALAVALVGFVLFALLWAALVSLPWGLWPAAPAAVACKVGADTLGLVFGAARSRQWPLLPAAPLFSLGHLLLFPLLQLSGLLLPVQWKGRSG